MQMKCFLFSFVPVFCFLYIPYCGSVVPSVQFSGILNLMEVNKGTHSPTRVCLAGEPPSCLLLSGKAPDDQGQSEKHIGISALPFVHQIWASSKAVEVDPSLGTDLPLFHNP